MEEKLLMYKSVRGRKERLSGVEGGKVGMYVCGGRVYGDGDVGDGGGGMRLDIVLGYVKEVGYKVG